MFLFLSCESDFALKILLIIQLIFCNFQKAHQNFNFC